MRIRFMRGNNQIIGDYLSARGSCTGNGEGTASIQSHFGPDSGIQLLVAHWHVVDFPLHAPHGFHSRALYEIKIGMM
jgi:hypothetical protein